MHPDTPLVFFGRHRASPDTLPTYDDLRSDVVEQLFYVVPLICYAQTLNFIHDRLAQQSQVPRGRSIPCHHDRE